MEKTVTESIGEQTKKYFTERLDAGYQVTDKKTMLDLVKDAMEKLNLKHGSSGRTKAILNKVLIERGIITVGKGFEKKADGIEIVLEGKKPEIQTAPAPTEKRGFLGVETKQEQQTEQASAPQTPLQDQTQQQTKPPLPPLSQEQLPSYKRKTSKIISLGQRVYLKFGIITEDEKKQYEKEYADLSEDMADYCIENNCRLPKQLELYLILAQIGFLFVVPVFKWLFKPKKKDDKKDEKKPETK